MTSKIMCIIHMPGSKVSGEIKRFTEDTWTKVKNANRTRKEQYNKSTYLTRNLPESDENDGYHFKCYQNFRAVPKVSSTTASSHQVSKRNIVLMSDTGMTSGTSSGIFPRFCIFCNHVLKSIDKSRPGEQLGSCEYGHGAETIRESAETLQDYKCWHINIFNN